MFSMFSDLETDDPEFDELVKNLKGIKILATDETYAGNANFYKEIINKLPMDQYKELMVIKEKDQQRPKFGKINSHKKHDHITRPSCYEPHQCFYFQV